MVRRVPRNLRETFDLLLLHTGSDGLGSIIGRMDWEGVQARQIYFAALGRLPESSQLAKRRPDYSPSEHLLAALSSREFQENVIANFLDAYPEKRREIFIHIPKCAGTDLIETLEVAFPRLNEHLPRRAETSIPELFGRLHRLVARTHSSDAIAVTGHIPLAWFEQRRLLRFGDNVYTVVREPFDLYISYANFILTRLTRFRGQRRSDTDEWLGHLGLEAMPGATPKPLLLELARKILRHQSITTPNMICSFLGDSTCETALARLAIHDVEITDVGRYTAWRKQRWNWDWDVRHNESLPLVSKADLSPSDVEFIDAISREDQKVYRVVMRALERRESLSLRGSELE